MPFTLFVSRKETRESEAAEQAVGGYSSLTRRKPQRRRCAGEDPEPEKEMFPACWAGHVACARMWPATVAQATRPANILGDAFARSTLCELHKAKRRHAPLPPVRQAQGEQAQGGMPRIKPFPRLARPHEMDQDRTKQQGLHNHRLHATAVGPREARPYSGT